MKPAYPSSTPKADVTIADLYADLAEAYGDLAGAIEERGKKPLPQDLIEAITALASRIETLLDLLGEEEEDPQMAMADLEMGRDELIEEVERCMDTIRMLRSMVRGRCD